ncbi:hypothetical protein [Prosthecobacter sp.]
MIKIDIAEVKRAADGAQAGRKTFPAPVQRSHQNQRNRGFDGFVGFAGSF